MQWVGKERGFVGAKDAAGLADLILIRDDRLIFAEVKGTGGKLTPKQIEFLNHVQGMCNPHVSGRAWGPGDEAEVEAALARSQKSTKG